MLNSKRNVVSLTVVIVFIIFVVFYIYRDLSRPDVLPLDNKSETENSISNKEVQVDKTGKGEGYTVKVEDSSQKSSQQSLVPPEVEVPVVDYGNLEPAFMKILTENVQFLIKELKTNPQNEGGWLQLAIYKKTLRDYKASIEILDYVAILWPKDYIPFNNLADLYQFYVKNYPLAEKNWLKVIELKPDYTDAYKNLFALYDTVYTEKREKALPVLLKGIDSNPKAIDLMISAARYYKTAGDKLYANIYYSKAVSEAKLQGNQQLQASIQSELDALSR